ncbi:hypothetical protein [Caulobacter sp. 17J80-11]|uniref:hypothetical protein n=1 Tax=Caulobacter sp. 17J80-11 TaxID=2763502 RepID=UPI0016535368|nr:hypothetical protein [Caulobacter sp. 17J80-11]MBC6981414.1 hypothetical protein [Caulobacter sp. 17J80-11]
MPRALATLALAALVGAAALPAHAKPPRYTTAEWRLVRVFAPAVQGPQRGLDVWVLEADLKKARKGKKRERPARMMVRENDSGTWSVATARFACKRDEVEVKRIERFTPGAGAPSVEKVGKSHPLYAHGPEGAIRALLCEGGQTDAPVARGTAAAFTLQDEADAAFAGRMRAGAG